MRERVEDGLRCERVELSDTLQLELISAVQVLASGVPGVSEGGEEWERCGQRSPRLRFLLAFPGGFKPPVLHRALVHAHAMAVAPVDLE